MLRYVAGRIYQAIITLFLVSVALFFIGRLTGNPCELLLPPDAKAADFTQCAHDLGLDKPIYVQYWMWASNAVRGNFGNAYTTGLPVTELIKERFPNSIKLGVASLIFTTLISFPIGLLGAVKKNTPVDTVMKLLSVAGQSIPGFWLGIMLILIFAVKMPLLPVAGMGGVKYYVLPVLTMGWWTVASQSRLLRSSLIEISGSEFIKLARIKGVAEPSVILKHELRNALIPVVTFIGLQFASVVASGVISEVVFAWPGLGYTLFNAIKLRDFPVIQAIVLLTAVITVIVSILVDILYAYIDPRIGIA